MWGKGYGKDMGKFAYGGSVRSSPYDGYGKGKGYGKPAFGGFGMPMGYDEADYGGGGDGGGSKKKRGGGGGGGGHHGGYGGSIDGLEDALKEAFETAGVAAEETDVESLVEKIYTVMRRNSAKFFGDERTSQKMTSAQARAYVEEYVETIMSALSGFLADKPWFSKVGWHGVLLMATFHAFGSGKIFTRTLKTEIVQFIESGLIAWSEDDRILKAIWEAIDAAGIQEGNHQKKANTHLTKAYDEAHFNAPFGESSSDSQELGTLQDFVKGWMSIFVGKAFHVFENGLKDGSPSGQVSALTGLFSHLLDPNVAAVPLSLQNSLPEAPWSYIEQCANEVMAENADGGKKLS